MGTSRPSSSSHIMKTKKVVIFRELISTCCQNVLGGILKVSLLSSFTCSKNLAKSSCG
jgi:hypothetical protein